MQKNSEYRPSFDALAIMKRAVKREIRRHKALGQYIVVVEEGQIKRISFALDKPEYGQTDKAIA